MTLRSAAIPALVAGATLAFSAPALAVKKPPAPKVVLSGCPFVGMPAVCVEMKGPHGKLYNVSLANPAAPIGTFIILAGTESQAHSFCRGIVLEKISWKPTKRACPKPG